MGRNCKDKHFRHHASRIDDNTGGLYILHVLLMVAKYVKCVSEVRCVNHAFKTAFHFLSSLLFLSLQRCEPNLPLLL